MNTYIHILNGRLRIKVPEVKRAPEKASEVVHGLQKLEGVTEVRANPTTGSVLVLFQPDLIDVQRIIQVLQQLGCLVHLYAPMQRYVAARGAQRLAETILQSALKSAIQKAILGLI
jgi:copper chaperone CopZ